MCTHFHFFLNQWGGGTGGHDRIKQGNVYTKKDMEKKDRKERKVKTGVGGEGRQELVNKGRREETCRFVQDFPRQ